MRRLTCNNSMAYLKNWTDNFFQMFFMGTSWVAVSINNIKTRASREITSRRNIKFFYFNGVNVAKHWHVAGRCICHLWLPCYDMKYLFKIAHVPVINTWAFPYNLTRGLLITLATLFMQINTSFTRFCKLSFSGDRQLNWVCEPNVNWS